MKKLVLMFSALFFAGTFVAKAQDVPMAVLQKGDDTQCFYGSGSFCDACKAADHGDIITLSEGIFTAPTITKAVSIFGSGADLVADTIEKPLTRMNGDIHVAVDSVDGKPATGLYMEGIFSNEEVWVEQHLEQASFAKCRFKDFNFYASADTTMTTSKMCNFFQCRFAGYLEPGDANALAVHNSVINNIGFNTGESTVNIFNCVVFHTSTRLQNAVFKNSYVCWGRPSNEFHSDQSLSFNELIHSSCSAFNCFSSEEDNTNNVFYNLTVKINMYYSSNNVHYPFKYYFANYVYPYYSDIIPYELTDDAKTKYLGTDGNPICLYGGDYPYTTRPSVPYIVEKNIGTKSENGKLKVSVKVAVPGASL